MHEQTFRNALSKSHLNPYFLEIANIREQCSWVHGDRKRATDKAKELVAAAINRALLLEPLTPQDKRVVPASLVIGGGIAGLQAALDIAESGFHTYLIEKEPRLGGHVAHLSRTFPQLEESDALINPKVEAALNHPSIKVFLFSEIEGIEGSIGSFRVHIRKKTGYVDEKKCTACGDCLEVCPVEVARHPDPDRRGAIYAPDARATPRGPVIDREACRHFADGSCDQCRRICPEGAIIFELEDHFEDFEVGTIVLATGHDVFNPAMKTELGYEKYSQVMSAPEFERLSRQSESKMNSFRIGNATPRSIAFVQCVGSRDKTVGNAYCSRVCCSYTAKQALWARQHFPDADVTVFTIDVRTFGKGCEELYEEAQKSGVIYKQGVPSEVFRQGESVILRGEDVLLGQPYEKAYDLVVLATGLVPSRGGRRVGTLFKLPRSPDGFFMEIHPKMRPLDAAGDGIFLAGTCQGPKDIADTLAQAHGAASRAMTALFQGSIAIEPVIAFIDEALCSGCGLCELACEYAALRLDPYRRVMTANAALCKGCGACNSVCPAGAIVLRHYKPDQIMAQVYALCHGA